MSDMKADETAVAVASSSCTDITIQAAALKVVDADTLTLAGTLKNGAQALLKEIDKLFEKPKKATDAAHKTVVAEWRGLRTPVEVAMTQIKAEISGFHRREKERVEAARRAEQEKQRKLEEERRIEAAIRAEEKGDTEKAEELIDAVPEMASAPLITVPPPVAKPDTIVMAEIYKAKVTSLFKLVEFIVGHPEYLYLVDISQTKANSLAKKNKQLKHGDELMPGLEVVIEDQVR